MIVLSCDSLRVAFGSDVVLDSVTFSLNEGDRLGVVGVNGAGKSTLLHVINGDLEPESGSVFISKNKSVGLLTQLDAFDESRPVYDEMLLPYSPLIEREKRLLEMRSRLDSSDPSVSLSAYTAEEERFASDGGYVFRNRVKGLLRRMQFEDSDFGRPISSLSGGQKTRLSLVRLLLREPDVLMLDEPTNHLDLETLAWLEDGLSRYKKTILVVSHDRFFLDKVCNKILDVENGTAKLYSGNYSTFVEKKKADRAIAERHYKNQQKEIARIEAYIEQQKRWNREKNIIAAESRQKALDRMVKLDRPASEPDAIRLRFQSSLRSGDEVLKARGLSKSFGDRVLFSGLDFTLLSGQRLFILGPNGCGKSTLMKILAGKLTDFSGRAEFGYNVRAAYYDQENQQLDPQNTVMDELWNAFPHLTMTEVRNALALFLFKGDDVEKKVAVLSGGEKARLTMVKLILSKVNLLLLDEPTNHLDIRSREALEDAILQFDGTVIAVSHDRYFIRKIATRFLVFTPSGILDYEGDYEQYLAFRASLKEESEQTSLRRPGDGKADYLKAKKQHADQKKREREYQRVKAEIGQIESRLDEIAREEETHSTDAEKIASLWEEREKAEERLLSLYEFMEENKDLSESGEKE